MTTLPTWAVVAVSFGTPVLTFAGVLVAQAITRRGALEMETRSRREETMRTMRWAAELSMRDDDRLAKLGVSELDALLDSDLLEESEKVFVEAALDAVYDDVETELDQTQHPIPADLRRAGSEVVLALADIVLDGAVNATPPTVALRTTESGLRSICETIGTAGELAAAVKGALDAPNLTTTARAAQARLAARSAGPWQESPVQAWLDPRDLQADRSVPIPTPLAVQLRRQGHHLACVTSTLASVPLPGVPLVQPPRVHQPQTIPVGRTTASMPR